VLQTDRRALPRHEFEATAEYVAPASDLEAAVCSAWQAVLHRSEPISVHANFFELGGNSLQAGALCSRLHTALSREAAIPIVWVMECQTIRALAARLADAGSLAGVSALPPLLPTVIADGNGIKEAPLSFQQVCTLHRAL
jgi:Phosphopantetheine attachment site